MFWRMPPASEITYFCVAGQPPTQVAVTRIRSPSLMPAAGTMRWRQASLPV